jgi:ATP-dependent Lon protease
VGKYGKRITKLQYILNITPTNSDRQIPGRETVLDTLNKRLYKLDKVKEEIVEAITASKYSYDHGLRILLIGNPGTGKTTIIKAIAEAYGFPYDIVHLNAATSGLELKGTDSTYDNAEVGKLVKIFYQLGTTEAVIGLDEIDKMSSGSKDGNPADALLDTLSDEHLCYDAFLETSIDTRNTIYIATANSTENIPEPLLNRFRVIVVDDYEDEDKVAIAEDYVIPQLLEAYDLTESDIKFPREVLRNIVRRYCCDNGVRMLKDNIHSIIRKIINDWDEAGKLSSVVVTDEMVNSRLEPIADVNSLQMRYHRNKELFSKAVRTEIKEGLNRLQGTISEPREKEAVTKKLEYLTSIVPTKGGFETFDKDAFFACVSGTHFGMLSVKEKIAKSFNAKALKGKSYSSERLLLAGGPGIGKSSICKSIAKGLGIPYIKISLNGVSDAHTIKGFVRGYLGSDAGIIVRELARAKTTRVLIQLDEMDKLGSEHGVSASSALLDLLDNSSEYTDEFLGVPLDLSNVLFIATANDVSGIEPWLLDRFSVIQLDGYTYSDKEQILDGYLMPKLEKEYAGAGISFAITDEAKESLLKDYCTSFGVRDLEKALEKIANDLLFENAGATSIIIEAKDVGKSLGPKPIPRGNLLKENVPGFSKALAVSGDNSSMAFAIESAIIPSANDTCITGLPKESAIDSVKLAKTYIRTHYLTDGEDFGVHLHFGEGAVVKDGPSAGVAIMVSMLSAVFETPVVGNVAYTGEIDLFGNVFAIGGTAAKIQAAERSGCSKVFIPKDNYEQLSGEEIEQFSIEIIPVERVSEVVSVVLPDIRLSSKCLIR